jgi:hypothetical protein
MELDPFIARLIVGVVSIILAVWFVDILVKGYNKTLAAKQTLKLQDDIEKIRHRFHNLVEVDTKISYIDKLRVRVRFRQGDILAGFILNRNDAPYEPVLYIAAPDDDTRVKMATAMVSFISKYNQDNGYYPDALMAEPPKITEKDKARGKTSNTTFEA